tara:strand:+ start:2678 stop:3979 length:1302 start_codon:yes stop_codon:yes gene_type:complete
MKLRPFELALVVIFGGLALLAMVMLSIGPGSSDDDVVQIGAVSIWGTIPQAAMDQVLYDESELNEQYAQVSYRYIDPTLFNNTLVNALADGTGPDLILVSQEKLTETRRRIQPISFDSFSVRDIRNSYVDGAEIFALSDGLYALPIVIDPLVMYWNRDILANDGLLNAPATWENLVNSALPTLIDRDFDRTINQAVVAMGEYQNVRNAFGVISSLLIQSGSELVQLDEKGGYVVRLQSVPNSNNDPLESTIDFYTRFSSPSNSLYSWNRSLPEDRSLFLSSDLIFYFGYGSEGVQLEQLNPNLNFDIAEIPQGATDTVRRTYGKFYGLSLLNASANRFGAGQVMNTLSSARVSGKIAELSDMVPASRSLVGAGSNDTYGRISYSAASVARGWLNPELQSTEQIFSAMTEDVNENRRDAGGAASDASVRIGSAY